MLSIQDPANIGPLHLWTRVTVNRTKIETNLKKIEQSMKQQKKIMGALKELSEVSPRYKMSPQKIESWVATGPKAAEWEC